MSHTTLFFDLDDTLYPKSSGLWNAIRERMHDTMTELLGLPVDQVESLRQHYLETYGTTLRGLQINHHVDTDKYLADVHDLPLQQYIKPDPELGRLLTSLPQRKIIFTNADSDHARRVLATLGINNCFEQIIDIRALGFICKPDPSAYLRALELSGVSSPAECILFDDAPRNLYPAREQGWYTVLVGSEGDDPSADQSITSLHALPRALPQLWDNDPHFLSRDG